MRRSAARWTTASALVTLLSLSFAAAAGDWPDYRGPGRSAVSAETGWRTDWPEGGPKRLWKVNVGNGAFGYCFQAGLQGAIFHMMD